MVVRQLNSQGKIFTFKNDELGNVIEMKVFQNGSNEVLFTQHNRININGDETESIGLNKDGSVHSESYYDYKYDSNGNWILRNQKFRDGKVQKTTHREIYYHSGK